MKRSMACFLFVVVWSLASCSFEESDIKTLEDFTSPAVRTTISQTEAHLETAHMEPASDSALVRVVDYVPDIVIDLRYATADNFTGQIVYSFQDVYLRFGTVKKLMQVQEALRKEGLSLKIWDGFRPVSAQFALWELCPDPTYVSDPNNGFSSHSRGNTVDITLVDQNGNDLAMPTGFDDFSALADRDYSDCSEESSRNAQYLEDLMTDCGFKGYHGEWWHYTDTDLYEVEMDFLPQ